MIAKLEKVTLYVEDQEAAKRFWTEQLGFVVVFEMAMGPSAKWIEVAPKGEGLTTLVLYSKQAMLQQRPEMVAHPSLMFTTADVEGLHAELTAAGVKVDEVQKMPWGKMFNFHDPDGNRFMIRG